MKQDASTITTISHTEAAGIEAIAEITFLDAQTLTLTAAQSMFTT